MKPPREEDATRNSNLISSFYFFFFIISFAVRVINGLLGTLDDDSRCGGWELSERYAKYLWSPDAYKSLLVGLDFSVDENSAI